MCGIAGLFRPQGGLDLLPLPGMVRSLAHRGPDAESLLELRGAGGRMVAGLGVRRLAIVDPAGGAQPVADASGRYQLCFNGEVYNHRRLRTELSGSGVPFRGQGDAEVVVNLIATVGLDTALSRLRGMFALALVDCQETRLTLVRDRMGVKPLYWSRLPDGTIAWGSELKALLAHPRLPRRPDRRALQAALAFEYIPAPWTPLEGVHKLEAGQLLEVDASGPRARPWWTPPLPQGGDGGDLDRWARSVQGSLAVATSMRMDADVEVGCLLSGGLDSSAVAALAQRQLQRPLRTFSVAVDAPGFDESREARRVAAALGTEHREARLGAEELPELLDEIMEQLDEPLADSSLVATWKLMRLVRDAGLRCVISGDGADESFGGYPTALAHRISPFATPFTGLLGGAVGRLRTSYEGVTRDYMAQRFVLGLGLPLARRHQIWMGAWLPEELGAGPELWEPVDRHGAACAGADTVSQALYLDQRLYLSEGVLVKVDRASMAHGVEVRSPFLDHQLVELAADIPVGHKLRGAERKVVLKRAMAELLPRETLARRKQGFGTPVGPWLRGPAAHLLRGLPEALEGLVAPELLRRVILQHQEGQEDQRRRLWSALIVARWMQGSWGITVPRLL